MNPDFGLRLELRMLPIVGGATETIFPAVEEFLLETEFQKALEFVAGRKKMNRYASMMDYLFCELAGHGWPRRCQLYYQGEGPQLQYLIDEAQRVRFEILLLAGLQHAYHLFSENREISWKQFRDEVWALAA